MAAYLIAEVRVGNAEQYQEYAKAMPGLIAKFGGQYLARGGEMMVLEGPREATRIVIIEFPSMGKVREFYHSPEYAEVKKLRHGAATGSLIAIQGV